MRPFAAQAALALLLAVITVMSSVGLLMTSAWLISTAGLRIGIETLGVAPTAVRMFGVSRAVFRYLERLVSHDVTFKLLARLRVWFYARLEPLSSSQLQSLRSGDLMARVVSDVDDLQNIYLRVLAPPLVAIVVTLATSALFALIHPMLGLGLFLCLTLGGTLLPLFTWWAGQTVGVRLATTRTAMSAQVVDSLQGLADSVAYGEATRRLAEFEAMNGALARDERRMARLDGAQSGLALAWVNVSSLGLLWLAIGQVDGVLLATVALGTLAAFEAITPLALAMQYAGKELAAAEQVMGLIHSTPTLPSPLTPAPAPSGALGVTFEDVHFRYTADAPYVLKGFSLAIPAGEMACVMGESGAGKSSLLNILTRFWDYEAGTVRLGSADLKTLAHEDVRRLLGVMTQRTYLFNTTVRENIRLARKSASDADVEAVARQAHLHDFIMSLPQTYDTDVGENGVALSGGQRQRVALARLLLKDAPIWVLDEPTANLDPITAQEVMRDVLAVAQGRTLLLLAHRLSAPERAMIRHRVTLTLPS
jgi:ATP-binding cassette subfamily C protein CydC